ncbi:MAG TPA: hypothetical protein VGJ48_13185 [Pyrinomonadaceae bacterium]
METSNGVNIVKRLENRIARLKRRANQLERVSNKYWTARRVLFVSGVLLSVFFCRYSGQLRGWVCAASFFTVFCAVAVYHRKVRDSIARHSLMLDIKQTQLARIHLDWDKIPPSNQSSSDTAHPFEADLDLTGERSLHRLLDTAVTSEGSNRLKSWLLNTTPAAADIRKRQALVRELKDLSLFRDKLHLLSTIASTDAKGRWQSKILNDWIEHQVHQDSLLSTARLLGLLAGLNITLIILGSFGLIPNLWPIAFLVYVSVMIAKQARIATAWGELQELEATLRRFRVVFQYLESFAFENRPGLAQVCLTFRDKGQRPSAQLRRVERIASALGLRTNPVLWLVVHAFIPWDFYFTYRLALLKEDLARLLPGWLDAWYEIEALNSLANFAYLNPRYTFPEIAAKSGEPERAAPLGCDLDQFDASALGHPLIKPEFKVCNDFRVGKHNKISILTGSNMAGKSTFIRTVGINLCLAYAGAPVNADRLEVSPFRVFTCIKVSDSVQDGLSYFYAEVKRLKKMLSLIEEEGPPVFFLIDEIYRGTNSRERHIGSHALIRTLSSPGSSDTGAVGIIATHDLELVTLADEIPGVANFHLRDELQDGKMVFDYLLRPGPCPTTNALKLMQLEGLPIEF